MLRHWIPIEKLNLELLLKYNLNINPVAISILENDCCIKEECESGDKSGGGGKSKKMSIDSILEGFPDIDWSVLSFNPGAISLLEQNLDKIDWV